MGNVAGSVRGPYNKSRGYSVTSDGYILVQDRAHPLASSVGQVLEHRKVLYDTIGPGPHPCHWCGVSLEWGGAGGILADHLNEQKQDNRSDNLVPSCSGCNTRRSRLPL